MVQLSLSTTIAGWLASINYIGYFIGALIAMFVPQRSTWQAMTLWAIISVVTTMLLVIPNMSLTLWYIIRLIAGIASGVAMILSSSFVIQTLSPERRSVLSAPLRFLSHRYVWQARPIGGLTTSQKYQRPTKS